MKDNNLLNYKTVIKKMRKKGISEKEFHKMMERGEITVLAKDPDTQQILPFRVSKIHENGKVEGQFLQ